MKEKKWHLYLIVGLGLMGILVTYLIIQERHFGTIFKATKEAPNVVAGLSAGLCGGEGSYFDCGAVERSPYSSFAGIPLTSWGMFYFVFFTYLAAALTRLSGERKKSHAVLFIWYLCIGSTYAVFLLMISVFAIGKLCPLCLVIYGLLWASLGLMVLYMKWEGIQLGRISGFLAGLSGKADNARLMPYIAGVAAALVIAAMAAFLTESMAGFMKDEYLRKVNERLTSRSVEQFKREKAVAIDAPLSMTLGNPKAPVTIVEFSDFLCPYCADAEEILRDVLADNPEAVRLIFVNFPMDIDCNPVMQHRGHPGACAVARGAVCAARQGKFEEFYNIAFQMKLKSADAGTVMQIAKDAGVDMPRFQACMKTPESERELKLGLVLGKGLGVSGTPHLFVNGKPVKGPLTRGLLDRIIRLELDAAR